MLVFSAGQGSIVAVKFLQIAITYHGITFSNKGLIHSEPKGQKKKKKKQLHHENQPNISAPSNKFVQIVSQVAHE